MTRLALAFIMLLMMTGVYGHRSSSRRSPYRPYGPMTCQYKMWRQTTLINACTNKFLCQMNGGPDSCDPICIDKKRLCDSHVDCNNGYDEENCPAPPSTEAPSSSAPSTCPTCNECAPLEFNCLKNGERKCLPRYQLCDGSADCDNASDEQNCPAICNGTRQIRCSTDESMCAVLCDGTAECPPNSLGYVEDEPMPNCRCQIDTADSVCIETTPMATLFSTVDIEEAIAVCQTLPACLSVIKFLTDSRYYATVVDAEQVTSGFCTSSTTGVLFKCNLL